MILEKLWKEEIAEGSNGRKKNVLKVILFIFSLGYYLGVQLRSLLYKVGILKVRKLPCKVISMGNIAVGGTGKTPACLLVADMLAKAGRKVAVLSRGYRGEAKEKINVVSDGEKIILSERKAGDEPYLMARRLEAIPIITSRRRYLGGSYACDNFGVDAVILDDGFQHLELERDLDICLIDRRSGFGNGYLLPRGILREPLKGMRRASLFLITNCENFQDKDRIVEKIKAYKENPLIFGADYEATCLRQVGGGKELEGGDLKGKKVFAFSGIANPRSFVSLLGRLGADVTGELSFPDHYRYSKKDLEKIKEMAGKIDLIVTTEKDGVKLEQGSLVFGLTIFALVIRMKIEDENRFRSLILSVL